MAARTDSFTLIGRRLRKPARPMPPIEEMLSIAEALRRVDLAIAQAGCLITPLNAPAKAGAQGRQRRI
jgi:hypothetical protein